MNKTDIELFKQALSEGLSNRIEREIASCTEAVTPSRKHRAAMKRIINGKSPERGAMTLNMKKIVAILVAAVLLLASCAVAYRNEIRDFVENIYESFVKLNYSDDLTDGTKIEDVYELTYIPEGYSLEDTLSTSVLSKIKFVNSSGESIVFEQRTLNTANFYADIENGYTKIVDISLYDVYYKNTLSRNYYIWNDGKYTLRLITDINLSIEELEIIIHGIR